MPIWVILKAGFLISRLRAAAESVPFKVVFGFVLLERLVELSHSEVRLGVSSSGPYLDWSH